MILLRLLLLPLTVSFVTAHAEISQEKFFELANRDIGVPEEYVPGLKKLSPAQINGIRNAPGKTLLHVAAARGHQISTFALLSAGADVDARDVSGRTPLIDHLLSTKEIHPELQVMVLEFLVLGGADENARSHDGWTPLAAAVQAGNFQAAEFLLWLGAKVEPDGVPPDRLPAAIAKKLEHDAIARLLDEFRSEPDAIASNRDFRTALGWAVDYGHLDVVDALLASGADVNRRTPVSGRSLLHGLATRHLADDDNQTGRVAAQRIKDLIQRGANPDIRSTDGSTPLMFAAKAGAAGPTADALIAAGADINARNNEGLSVLGVARKYGRREMIAYLEALGAQE